MSWQHVYSLQPYFPYSALSCKRACGSTRGRRKLPQSLRLSPAPNLAQAGCAFGMPSVASATSSWRRSFFPHTQKESHVRICAKKIAGGGFRTGILATAFAGNQAASPSAGRNEEASRARAKKLYMNVSNILNRQMIWSVLRPSRSRASERARRSDGAGGRRRAGCTHEKRAQAPALMAEAWSGTPSIGRSEPCRSCVLGRQISRGLRCVPRQWQCRENAGQRVHRTTLGGGWDWPRSRAVAACWQLLC